MKDIYGEDYLIISYDDYNRMLERIEELEKMEKDHRDFINQLTTNAIQANNKMAAELIHFALNNDITITPKH